MATNNEIITEVTTTEANAKVTNGYCTQSTMSTDAIEKSLNGTNNIVLSAFDGFLKIMQCAAAENEKSAAAREAAETERQRQQAEYEAERQKRQQAHELEMEKLELKKLEREIELEKLRNTDE